MNKSLENQKENNNKNQVFNIPVVDIYEDENSYSIFAEMPGVKKENIDISLEKNELTIFGKVESKNKESLNSHKEYKLENYKRSFNINTEIKSDEIEAKYEKGLLKLTLPKSEKLKPKKIEISNLH